MAPPTPPADAMAELARGVIRRRLDLGWDLPHEFLMIGWTGTGEPTIDAQASIPLGIPPGIIPALMMRLVSEVVPAGETPTVAAFLFAHEGYTIDELDLSDREARSRLNQDLRAHTVSQRPDAVEIVTAYCVDLTGRLWMASSRRDRPGHIEESFLPDVFRPFSSMSDGDRFIGALVTLALATRALFYSTEQEGVQLITEALTKGQAS